MANDQKTMAREEEKKKTQEADEAAKNLEAMLNQSAPKNFGQGVTRGVGNILGAAVGACGIVVLVPTLGLAAGVKHGGVLGGALGLAGGAVVGALGAVTVAVGGAISGVTQIVRGVVATPAAIMAPRQGKWWNENEGKWIKTNLKEDAKIIEGIPKDDMDILGDAKEQAEAAAKTEITGNVKDPYYYDVLNVGPTAEPSAIKRNYYVLARKYHPDRVGKDDKEAADKKFKEIAEAYQVLSDSELRAKYDKDGREGLSADKTEVAQDAPKLDPAVLFAFLFGSDKFHNHVGRLATATSASIGDSPNITMAQAKLLQKRRVVRLALYLADKLDKCQTESATESAEPPKSASSSKESSVKMKESWKQAWIDEARDLAKASFGTQMVHLIGQIYTLAAEMFLGSMDSRIGMVSMSKWATSRHAKFKKSQAANKNKMDTLKAGLEAMQAQQKVQKDLQEAKTDDEKRKVEEKLADEMSGTLLKIMWTTTVVDITNTLHETCQMVMFDQSIDKNARKRRAELLKTLGEIFEECPEPDAADEDEKDAKKLYEEAAFAAMLETVKRKEEAANASVNKM